MKRERKQKASEKRALEPIIGADFASVELNTVCGYLEPSWRGRSASFAIIDDPIVRHVDRPPSFFSKEVEVYLRKMSAPSEEEEFSSRMRALRGVSPEGIETLHLKYDDGLAELEPISSQRLPAKWTWHWSVSKWVR